MLSRCIGAGVLLFMAVAAQTPEHKDRTLGYDDTPYLPGGQWRVHDVKRPRPPIVTPGTASSSEHPGRAPSDALVLFDGTNLSHWVTYRKGVAGEPAWKIENGYMEVVSDAGGIQTKKKFGNMQLHLEWATPSKIEGKSQERGNSGVMLMSRYEIQVLDSYDNPTYADGQAGAIYGQSPPLVNACRPPGEWQTYDIIFEAPKFGAKKLLTPAYVTVLQNGIVIQNHREIIGRTPHAQLGTYEAHDPEEPLELQNHGTPVRYRNIWIRRM